MSHDPLEAHARLMTMLRERIRTHWCTDEPPQNVSRHSRHPRHVDSKLAESVGKLLRQGYRPSTIRVRLRIGYNTIRRAIALLEKNNVGNDS